MSGIKSLTDREREIALECLQFISQGGRFDMEADCSIQIGISVQAFQKIISLWPEIDDNIENSNAFLAVNNSFNEVCHGPDSPSENEWFKYFSASRNEIESVYRKWAKSIGLKFMGVR